MKKRHRRQDAQTPEQISQADLAAAPLTPSEISEQSCPQCGALLPRPLLRLDTIPGQEHLRRAITVALTGQHTVTFLGTGTGLADALDFGRIGRSYGLRAYVATPAIRICFAAARRRRLLSGDGGRHSRPRSGPTSSSKPPTRAHHSRIAHRHGRRGESDEVLLARAAEARTRPRPSDELERASQRLLVAAIRQLQLTIVEIARLLCVAQSVAQLAGQTAVQPAHLAEALQYRPRILPIAVLFEPDTPMEA